MAKFISIPTTVTGQPNLVFNTDNISGVQPPPNGNLTAGTGDVCILHSQGKKFTLGFSGKTTTTRNSNAIAGATAINNSITSGSPAPIALQPGFNPITLTTPAGAAISLTGASGAGTTITVASTAGLVVGMVISVTAGTGAFTAGTTVSQVLSTTTFLASAAPTTALSGATILATQAQAGTTITVFSTSGLTPGMSVAVIGGTGSFSSNAVIETITSGTTFTVDTAPSTALLNATIQAAILNVISITVTT